jgi:putative redox protein
MADIADTSASDLQIQSEERIQPISVHTDYVGRYQSLNTIRDIPPFSLDEPTELGGRNAGPTALEMTLAALNSCSAMIMYVLSREMRFDLRGVRFETHGWVDVRRIEMRRRKLKYSEVEPVAEHYHHVEQAIHITTTETGERFEHFRSEVHRLCPMYALFRDAGVKLESDWILERPDE